MGLGQLFTRDVEYVATDTETGRVEQFTIIDGIRPDWSYGEYQGGMSLPGASRASTLVSDLIGSVPWCAYRTRAGTYGEKIEPTPLLLEQPAPPETRVTTLSSMALDLLWHGNAIAVIAARSRDGWPTAIVPVPAEWVHVRRVGLADTQIALPIGEIIYQVGTATYAGADVIHVKGPCRPGFLRGMGVIENHLNGTLALAGEQARQARSLNGSGIPTGVLKSTDPDFEQEDAEQLKSGWMRAQRDRTIAVLSPTTEFETVAWNPTETQLLEARKFSLHETALIFGLDPSWLGVSGDSMTYSNIEQKGLDLLKYSLNGHLARFEQAFTQHLPRGTWAEANLDAILRADTLTRFQAHALAVTGGWETVDEVRQMERRPPLTPAQREAAAPPAVAPPTPVGQALPAAGGSS